MEWKYEYDLFMPLHPNHSILLFFNDQWVWGKKLRQTVSLWVPSQHHNLTYHAGILTPTIIRWYCLMADSVCCIMLIISVFLCVRLRKTSPDAVYFLISYVLMIVNLTNGLVGVRCHHSVNHSRTKSDLEHQKTWPMGPFRSGPEIMEVCRLEIYELYEAECK